MQEQLNKNLEDAAKFYHSQIRSEHKMLVNLKWSEELMVLAGFGSS